MGLIISSHGGVHAAGDGAGSARGECRRRGARVSSDISRWHGQHSAHAWAPVPSSQEHQQSTPAADVHVTHRMLTAHDLLAVYVKHIAHTGGHTH
jgi:hypothetical protein